MSVLAVKNLSTVFYTEDARIAAVNDVSFNLEAGQALGIVGESGCGKSATALSIMRLIPEPAGKICSGQIYFGGTDLLQLSRDEIRKVRGNQISMIFQEPMTSLNPVLTIGDQIAEVLRLHQGLNKTQARKSSIEELERVGIPEPDKRINDYPHALSGGMRQRVMIAMALACRPKILICDEPTTALDVTIQAQILELMQQIQTEFGMSIIFISHDLGVIAEFCDQVIIMYAGRVLEQASVRAIFKQAQHPYTQALLNSIPRLGNNPNQQLTTIPGMVPNLSDLPRGCSFAERCQYAQQACRTQPIELLERHDGYVRCLYPIEHKQP